MSNKKYGEPGDVVELADKESGFTDAQTGFDISRDQKLALGDTVGEKTQQAIVSGGLLVVTGKAAKAAAAKDEKAEEEAIENAGEAASDPGAGLLGAKKGSK